MFDVGIWLVLAICLAAPAFVYARTRDTFHPLMITAPMFAVQYWYMPLVLSRAGVLDSYLDTQQLNYVQGLNVCGVVAFVAGCLSAGLPRVKEGQVSQATLALGRPEVLRSAYWIGTIGVVTWLYTIVNVGGFRAAFGQSYGGGWSDNGYMREGMMLLIPAMLLLMPAILRNKWNAGLKVAICLFATPLLMVGLLGARRGPTFVIAATLGFAWYLYQGRRPSIPTLAVSGGLLAFLVLFLVTNRNSIYIGSEQEMNYDVSEFLSGSGGGNEFVYGGGAILYADLTGKYYWGRRILAQFLVRPIPHELWPDKYADFGVPEMGQNAGTGGSSFTEYFGWEGAPGSAPGIVADLWIEFWWLGIPALGLIGWAYGACWNKALVVGGPWVLQYVILAALSLYLVMQTMEAVIYRLLLLSIPVWVTWGRVRYKQSRRERVSYPGTRTLAPRPEARPAP